MSLRLKRIHEKGVIIPLLIQPGRDVRLRRVRRSVLGGDGELSQNLANKGGLPALPGSG